ncbi:hypothetical protein [Pajaroellobacter abortibovis]|uniref:Uncharacterized protein n=1 Tax=Pajaroellobacter abortibovis TaxID=1882918 RepID=A0A1L6MVU6_9BACT|nr:hypothetical protein [Pajaroellobacter abortibovis]APR99547.1 hypothetical protein BCY86_01765 [Pajaroellobacter abortibovis]
METHKDLLFLAQASQFHLCYTCDEFIHFDLDSERCIHGYPYPLRLSVDHETSFCLCKEFELGGDCPDP